MSWPLFITILEVGWFCVLVPWIVLEKRSPTATLAWIFGLMLLPVVGVPFYLLIGPRRLERKKSRLLAARAQVGRLLEDCEWFHEVGAHSAALMKVATRTGGVPPMRVEYANVFADGDAKYDALLRAIAEAKHHIHLEYYIFRDDETGRQVLAALMKKARAGVEVRLLIDAVGASLSDDTEGDLDDAGVKLFYFNPAFSSLQRIFNFRTHRKIVVIDGTIGFTGGINITDDQSARTNGQTAWRDTSVEIRGEAVQGLQRTFLENWNFASNEKKTGKELDAYFPEPRGRGDRLVQIIASGPDDGRRGIEAFFIASIGSAQKRVWLTTPYFVPNEPLHSAIVLAAMRGVDVRIILPHQTDSRAVDLASATFHDALLRAGVRIYIYGPPMLHAKTSIIDDVGVIGSANLDDRSLRLNFEVVAAFYGGPVVEALTRQFEADHERAKLKIRLEEKAPLHRQLITALARLFAPQL